MKRSLIMLALSATLFACGEENAVSEQAAAPEVKAESVEKVTAPETKIEAGEAQSAQKFANEIDAVSYSAGVNIAGPFVSSIPRYEELGYKFNNELILKGFKDALDSKIELTDDEMRTIITEFHQKVQAKQKEVQDKLAAEQTEKGKTYLDENKKKEGVKVTESGLQYRELTKGTGPMPKDSDTVEVHYKGTLTDGTVFDSSYERGAPVKFPVNGVIKGWVEGLQLMNVGSKFELTIPSDLGYGERGTPNIPPNSVLVFEVELLSIVDTQKPVEPTAAQ